MHFLVNDVNILRGGEGTSRFSRLGKLEFPKFQRDDVKGWLFRVKQFFANDNVHEEDKIKMVSIHLFGAVNKDPMAELKNLRYGTSMKEYQSQFEQLLTQVDMIESQSVSMFIVGFPTSMEMNVRMFMLEFINLVNQLTVTNGETLVVQGDKSGKDLKIVSAIKMRIYLEKDCVAFLAHVVDKGSKGKGIKDILGVRNDLEVFLEDLSGLPPRSKKEHEKHMDIVLRLLKTEKLYVQFSKYEFWLRELHFLGYVVNKDGIHVDTTTVKAIRNWEAPRSPIKMRHLLGLVGYYQRFINNLSKIAKPLTELTQKKK
nr:putative reverse transcriptase domain-containing protein [Tanacetum cinerariifolium]